MSNLIKKLSLILFLSVISVFFASGAFAATSPKPTVSRITASTVSLPYVGGSVSLSATVKNATRCLFRVTPAVTGAAQNKTCTNSKVTYKTVLPANSSSASISYVFKLTVIGKGGTVVAIPKTVVVAATPAVSSGPIIISFTASATTLPSSGGTVTLTAIVANEISCSVLVSGSSYPVPCSTGTAVFTSTLLANTSSAPYLYNYVFTVIGSSTSVNASLTVTVDSESTTPPPVTTGNTIPVPAQPDAFVLAGNDIWVASCSGNALTAINRSTDQVVDTITGPTDGLSCPDALAFDGTHIWVANKSGNSITELNASDGSLVQTISGSRIYGPDALVVTNNSIWIANVSTNPSQGSSICKFSLSGVDLNKVIQTPSSLKYTSTTGDMVFDDSDIWTVDASGSAIYEFNADTGTYVRTLAAGLNGINSIYYYGGYIWANGSANSLVGEYSATTGATVRKIAVSDPIQLVYNGSHLFVVSDLPTTQVLREYTPAGTLVATITKTNSADSRAMEAILLDGNRIWTMNYISSSVSVYNF
jgi:hypothetical protein